MFYPVPLSMTTAGSRPAIARLNDTSSSENFRLDQPGNELLIGERFARWRMGGFRLVLFVVVDF